MANGAIQKLLSHDTVTDQNHGKDGNPQCRLSNPPQPLEALRDSHITTAMAIMFLKLALGNFYGSLRLQTVKVRDFPASRKEREIWGTPVRGRENS